MDFDCGGGDSGGGGSSSFDGGGGGGDSSYSSHSHSHSHPLSDFTHSLSSTNNHGNVYHSTNFGGTSSPSGTASYDIPMSVLYADNKLDNYSLPSISTVTSTLEYPNDNDDNNKHFSSTSKNCTTSFSETSGINGKDHAADTNGKGRIDHGFFFGAKSTELLNGIDKENESGFIEYDRDDDEESLPENIDIRNIYSGYPDLESWMRASQNSIKPSPEITKRDVLSKRIKDVGHVGQNIGIGHLTGVLKEDKMLIPTPISLNCSALTIGEDSPLQQEISWSRPDNASTFSSIFYNIEVILPGNELWEPATSSSARHTVFRIYHTDHKLLVGKHKIDRKDSDVTVYLRVCCQGEITVSVGAKHWTQGPWSKEIPLVFLGYTTKPTVIEQTAL